MTKPMAPNVSSRGIWSQVVQAFDELKVCRFSLIVLLVGAFVFIKQDQGVEVLRALGENHFARSGNALKFFSAIMAALAWALASWYCSRVLLYFRFPSGRGDDVIEQGRGWLHGFLVEHLPRVFGVSPLLILAAGFWTASRSYGGAGAGVTLTIYAVVCVFATLLLYLYLVRRNPVPAIARPKRASFGETGRGTKVAVIVMATLSLGCCMVFIFDPIPVAGALGTTTVLLTAAACWVCMGSAAVYWSSWHRFPIVFFLFAITVVFSQCNDNHIVRNTPGAHFQRKTLDHAFDDWYARQKTNTAEPMHPLFIVTTEGGGIRAAYWTAVVLGALEDQARAGGMSFADHLFAISSVSGGSLGAAAFDAALVTGSDGAVSPRIKTMLGTDLLAPAIAALLYPDLFQRFLPCPIEYLDRGRVIEEAWERAASASMGTDLFSQDIDAMWSGNFSRWVPCLFLNGTLVETGQRIIASNLIVYKEFKDAIDVSTKTPGTSPGDAEGADIPLSTAAHGSARFTFVSPAGRFPDGTHIVDGGYFENSGATTGSEVLDAARRYLAAHQITDVLPVIITISNDPLSSPAGGRFLNAPQASAKRDVSQQKPSTFMIDVLAPLNTLFNTRNAHDTYAQEALVAQQGYVNDYYFGLSPSATPLPLGWMLSDAAMEDMDNQIQQSMDKVDGKDNPAELEDILKLMKPHAATR